MKAGASTGDRIPIAHEELYVDKKTVETGRLRVRTSVDERMASVQDELAGEDVQVEWVEVNREVDGIPEIRTEGATLVIPLFEEVLVVEKRLVLRRELRLTRRISTRPFDAEVPLRRMRADVERTAPLETQTATRETTGAPMRTLSALYDTRDHAEAARQQLLSAGLAPEDISLSSAEGDANRASDRSDEHGGFLHSVKSFFMPDEDRRSYAEGMSRGGILLVAHVPEGEEDRMIAILDRSGAVDFDAREAEWREAGGERRAEGPDDDAKLESDRDVAIPIAEERLNVGKRDVERGSVRVRSYVTEKPVQEQVTLREEHVNVERRPVNERVEGAADRIFEERSFEMVERGEEAVVGKETVVTDELHVSKEATERTEDIEDTVRRTEVDVDDARGRTKRDADERGAPRDA